MVYLESWTKEVKNPMVKTYKIIDENTVVLTEIATEKEKGIKFLKEEK